MTSTEHVNHNHHQHHYEESVRDIEQIHHVNETISQDDSYRAQTEASNIQIVTPHYKSGERPGSEVRTGASAAELNAKFAATNGDYKAERSQEHFRMQIIDPKVNSNAHLPAHAPREYARKKLIDDFPSLHSKRSFLDLDALEQRTTRKPKPISISKYLTDSVDRHPKKDDFRDLDKLKKSLDALQKRYSKPMEHQIEELDLSKIPLAPRSPFLVRAYAPDSNHNNLEDYSKQKDYSNAASISAESTLKNGTVNFDISTVNKTKIPAKNAPMLDNISDDNYYRNSIEKFRQNQEENRIPTQEHNQDQNPNKNYDNDSSEGRVIIWPPLNEKRVDIVVNKPRSIFDESSRAEFERQKAREIAAMRRRDAAASKYRAKQHEAQRFQRIRALEKARELEKDQILDLKINASSSRHDYENETESNSTYDNENENTVKTIHGDPNYRLHIFEAPSNLRIVNGEDYDNATRRFWERTFPPLDGSPKSRVSTRNEILTSEELIRREFTFDIDLLERRNAFIESSSEPPKIHYLGRRWHPPPEDPANVPHTPNDSLTNEYQQNGTMDFAFNIDEYCDSHYSNGLDGNNTISHRKNNNTTLNTRQKHSNDNTISEYKWIPTVNNSEYAGHDSGELDAAARRQLRDVVVPSSDGSHRPNTVFARVRRRIPAGGFSPHAPNVVKAASEPKRSATNQHNSELDELARRSREIAERSRYARSEYHIEPLEIKNSPKIPYSMAYSPRSTVSFNETPKCATVMTSASSMPTVHNQENESGLLKSVLENGNSIWASTLADSNGGYGSKSRQRYSYASTMKSLLREEPPPAPPVVRTVVRHEPVRQEIVEVRREVKPRVTQNVQRFEERKRTEEVERRVIRRERRHKSSRIRYGHHAGGHHEFHQDWSSGGARKGVRSNSAASRNGYGGGGHGDYYYHHGSSRYGGGADSAASDFFHRGSEARYGGSVSDSLRRGDLKYGPNGDVRQNGHNGNASEKYSSTRRVHKSYSTRDVHGGGSSGYGSHQPVVEFPPTLPRHSASSRYGAPAPPPHRQNGFQSDYYYGGSGGGGGYGSAGDGRLTKSRSYADWGDGGRGPFGNSSRRYNDDMARLENEFRDSLLMKLPTNGGTMNERDYRHEQIPGGYETYEREVKASSGRKNYPDGVPTDFKETSHGYNIKRETQR